MYSLYNMCILDLLLYHDIIFHHSLKHLRKDKGISHNYFIYFHPVFSFTFFFIGAINIVGTQERREGLANSVRFLTVGGRAEGLCVRMQNTFYMVFLCKNVSITDSKLPLWSVAQFICVTWPRNTKLYTISSPHLQGLIRDLVYVL